MGTHTVSLSSFFVFSLQAASVSTTITMAPSDFAAVGDDGGGTTAPNPGREERVVVAKMSDTEDLTTPAICGGVSSPSLTSAKPEKVETEVKEVVTIKEEEEEEGEDAGLCKINGDGSHSSSSSVSVVLPKPLEGLHESGPPPFLKKTFEMVDNPETDSMVSWSKGRDSFIVWDSHEFSKNMLPKYFKHSNFSSFIRQLNTYGFRKIDTDRWEFANEGFQRGKKILLKSIKRRCRYNKHQNVATSSVDSTKVGLEAEFESLKNDQKVLKMEILNLRQQQADSNNELSVVRERIRAAECKQLQMLILFAKVTKNPGFIQQLIHKRKQQGWLDGDELCKKRRLLHTQFPQSLTNSAHTGQTVNCRNQAQEQLAAMQTELAEILPETIATNPVSKLCHAPLNDEFCSHIQDPVANLMCATDTEDASFVYDVMSEKLMDDSSVGDNPVEEDLDVNVNDSKFYLELEDLIGRPGAWGGYVTELVEHASCVG